MDIVGRDRDVQHFETILGTSFSFSSLNKLCWLLVVTWRGKVQPPFDQSEANNQAAKPHNWDVMTLTMPVMVYSDRRGRADQWEHSIQEPWPIRGQGILSSTVREPKVVTVPLFHHRRTPLSRGFWKYCQVGNSHHRSHFSYTRLRVSCDEVVVITMRAPSGSDVLFPISMNRPQHCRCWGSDWGGGVTGVVQEGAGWLPRGQDQRHVLQLERRPGLLCPHTQIQASPHRLPQPRHQGLERVWSLKASAKFNKRCCHFIYLRFEIIFQY